MDILITFAVFGIPMFFLIRYLNKRAEKERVYYTHEQLREIEEEGVVGLSGYDKFGLGMYPYSLWKNNYDQ